jgi:addiction module HigA family antidote
MCLKQSFLDELGLSQQAVADLMGVSRKTVNELVNEKSNFTLSIAMILERVFGTPVDFWLNLQHQVDLWQAANSKRTQMRINKAKAYKTSKYFNPLNSKTLTISQSTS